MELIIHLGDSMDSFPSDILTKYSLSNDPMNQISDILNELKSSSNLNNSTVHILTTDTTIINQLLEYFGANLDLCRSRFNVRINEYSGKKISKILNLVWYLKVNSGFVAMPL